MYCDYDSQHAPALRRIEELCRIAGIGSPRWTRLDRTTHGWHVVVALGRHYTPTELLALQGLFGSDPRREALNFRRLHAIRTHGASKFWKQRWNLLFEAKV